MRSSIRILSFLAILLLYLTTTSTCFASLNPSQPLIEEASTINLKEFAYVLHALSLDQVCSALITFAILNHHESLVNRVLMYPREWDREVSKALGPVNEMRVRRELTKKIEVSLGVKMKPVKVPRRYNADKETYVHELMAWSLTEYKQVAYFSPNVLTSNANWSIWMISSKCTLAFESCFREHAGSWMHRLRYQQM